MTTKRTPTAPKRVWVVVDGKGGCHNASTDREILAGWLEYPTDSVFEYILAPAKPKKVKR